MSSREDSGGSHTKAKVDEWTRDTFTWLILFIMLKVQLFDNIYLFVVKKHFKLIL